MVFSCVSVSSFCMHVCICLCVSLCLFAFLMSCRSLYTCSVLFICLGILSAHCICVLIVLGCCIICIRLCDVLCLCARCIFRLNVCDYLLSVFMAQSLYKSMFVLCVGLCLLVFACSLYIVSLPTSRYLDVSSVSVSVLALCMRLSRCLSLRRLLYVYTARALYMSLSLSQLMYVSVSVYVKFSLCRVSLYMCVLI